MPQESPRVGLPYLLPAQAQKHVTHNEALQRLDAVTQLVVQGFADETPPALPGTGAVHGLGPAPTGAWAGQAGSLAYWDGTAWLFLAPAEGWRAWGLAEQELRVWRSGAWQPATTQLQNMELLGVNTTADTTNPLSVAGAATLFTHAGAGHQLKLNKATAGDTASLLFQSGWSGRAEIGLAGLDDLSVKVSPDGSAWVTALQVSAANGHLSGAAVQASATDTTPGRLMRADYGYGPGNILGTVSEASGVPTGALVERGSNANGEYVRFADGTQLCSHRLTSSSGGAVSWGFPAVFDTCDAAFGTRASSGDAHFATVGVVDGVSANVSVWGTGGSRVSEYVYLMAIGRWF